MKKVADFGVYKSLKNMSFNDFNRWIIAYYQAAFEDGKEAGIEETEKRYREEAEVYTFEELRDLLTTVRGISPRIADIAMDTIMPDIVEEEPCKSEMT